MDISREPKPVLEAYGAEHGKDSVANNFLLARRLAERGRALHPACLAMDHHGNCPPISANSPDTTRAKGRAVLDLQSRGFTDDTLVIGEGSSDAPLTQGED